MIFRDVVVDFVQEEWENLYNVHRFPDLITLMEQRKVLWTVMRGEIRMATQ